MENVYAVASSSSSTLYGNVGSAIKELIISKFPCNYFKYINVSTELAFRNVRRTLGYNNTNEMHKRLKPYLVIRPEYSVGSTDQFLNDIPLTKNFDNIQYGVDKRYLFNVLKDVDQHYELKFKMNRDKIDFNITLTIPTLHDQLDVYKAMVNQFVWDRPYAYQAGLESMIPRSMITYIAKLANYDLEKDINKIPLLIRYLNRISKYPITYKMRNASSTDEFYMYYNHGIIVNFTDLNIEEAVKKNMTDESYNITFKVSAEFNLPGLYILCGNNDTLYNMKIDLVSQDAHDNANEYIPLCTFTNFYSKYPSTLNGFKLYTTSIFNVEVNKDGSDTLDINELFDEEILKVLKANASLENAMNTLLNIYILKDNTELVQDTDWSIDYNKMIIKINKAEKASTYRIVIYINNLKINDHLIEIFENKHADTVHEANSKIINNLKVGTATIAPTQSKIIIPSTEDQKIDADQGMALQSVIVQKIPSQYTDIISPLSNEDIQNIINSL